MIQQLPQLVEAQPMFPHVDITEESASMIELILGNPDIVEYGRHQAEDGDIISPLFFVRMPDWPLVTDEPQRRAAFSHGISMYQTIGRLLQAPLPPNSLPLMRVSLYGEYGLMTSPPQLLDQYRASAVAHFSEAVPRAARAIHAAAERPHPGLGAYTISGAAVAYEFETYAYRLSAKLTQHEVENQ